jgi:hypothetical protein
VTHRVFLDTSSLMYRAFFSTPTTVVSTPLPAAAAAPAATGPAAEAAQPTPTDAEKAAWYTQQVSSEQDYCSCNQTSSSLSVVNPPKPNPTNP